MPSLRPPTGTAHRGLAALLSAAVSSAACATSTAVHNARPALVASAVDVNVDVERSALRTARLQLVFPRARTMAQRPLGGGDSGDDVQRVDVDGVAYVYKGLSTADDAEAVARARREVAVTQWAAERGFAPRVVYADAEARFYVSAFFETAPSSWQDGGRGPKLLATLQLLRRLHEATAQLPAEPGGPPLDEARALRALARVQQADRDHPALQQAVALMTPLSALLAPMPAKWVRCHGDVRPENVLYRPDATVLVDWAWTHVGDAMFELASFADQIDLQPTEADALLDAYGPHDPADALRFARLLLLRTVVRTIEDFVDTPWHAATGADRAERVRRHARRLEALAPAARLQNGS